MKQLHSLTGDGARRRFPFTHEAGPAHGTSPAGQPAMFRAIAAAAMAVGAAPAMALPTTTCTPGQFVIGNGVTHSTTCVVTTGQTLQVQAGGAIAPSGVMVMYGANAGTITNAGTIGGSTGIVAVATSTIGGLINTGTIGGSLHALSVAGAITGGVLNDGGTITGGIHVGDQFFGGGSIGGGIVNTNSGTIDGGNDTAIAVLRNSSVSGGIRNAAGSGISASAYAISVSGSAVEGGIANAGTVSVAGIGVAVHVDSGSTITGGITNAGTLSVGGSGNALQIGGGSTVTGGVTNSGTLAAGSYGIYATGTSTIAGGITNSGTILGAVAALVLESSSTVVGGVVNSGTVSGVRVSDSTITGGLTNSGTLGAAASGAAIEITGSAHVGVVRNQAGGLIDGALSILAPGTSVSNAGTIALPAATVSTIAGNYTQDAAGVLRIRVLNDTTYGQLSVGGTVTLPSNAKFDVDVANPNHAFTATGLANVVSAGTLVSDGTFAVTDNSVLFDFRAVKDGNTVDLVISAAGATGVYDSAAANSNSPAFGAARTLDGIIATQPGGPLAQLFTGLTTQQQVSNAATQTLPLLTGNSLQSAGIVNAVVGGTIQSRVGTGQGLPSGDLFLGDGRFWVKPFGSWADQGERQGVAGFKASVTGFATGFDVATAGPTRLGLAIAYAGVGVDSKSSVAPHRLDTDVYQFVGYGSHSLDATTDIGFQIDVGRNRNRGVRTITFAPSAAHSSFDSTTFHVGANLARAWALSSETKVIPSFRLDYTTLRDEAYAETGAGALNLNVDGRRVDQLVAGADVRLVHSPSERLTLSANVGAGYDVLAERSAIVASFAGAPGAAFTTYGAEPTPWVGRAGVGATYRTNTGMEIAVRYDAEHRTQFLNQTASVKLRWMF